MVDGETAQAEEDGISKFELTEGSYNVEAEMTGDTTSDSLEVYSSASNDESITSDVNDSEPTAAASAL